MDYSEQISKSVEIIRMAWRDYKKPMMLSSSGKDSVLMIYLAMQAFDYHKLPFPIIFVNTGFHFPETLKYTRQLAFLWNLDLRMVRNLHAMEVENVTPWTHPKVECCTKLKTDAWMPLITKEGYDLAFRGYRADEHPIRGAKPYFEHRENPKHTRCYPLLHWTYDDVWAYIRKVNIPVNPLYDKVIDGKVYKSLGCAPCTFTVHPEEKERAGRDNTKENAMKELDRLNY